MSKLITFLIFFTLAATSPPETSAQKSGKTRKDTFCIASSGSQNQVIINSKNATHLNDCTDTLAVKGTIVQRGRNNSIEIKTKNEIPNSKKQKTDKRQKTNTKTQTVRATCNKQHVTIKQTGKNNSVKINQK